MPDKYQFNDMGAVKHCIWCNYKVGSWVGEHVLASHHRKHRKDREEAAAKATAERALAVRVVN